MCKINVIEPCCDRLELQRESGRAVPMRYHHTLIEHRGEVLGSAVAFHPSSKSSGGPFPHLHPTPLHHFISSFIRYPIPNQMFSNTSVAIRIGLATVFLIAIPLSIPISVVFSMPVCIIIDSKPSSDLNNVCSDDVTRCTRCSQKVFVRDRPTRAALHTFDVPLSAPQRHVNNKNVKLIDTPFPLAPSAHARRYARTYLITKAQGRDRVDAPPCSPPKLESSSTGLDRGLSAIVG
ncbi:hypothetical protein EVAR_64686_1 [Eumeta japonica]|uniref:Uncharacterized protein n=1 Tax=Eumeta variegata TaxID=151549 RepID=A0A4C1ZQE3_EUMVA|nr:hypothetical protein EVAR_64686_1 [Eumeta japonica]